MTDLEYIEILNRRKKRGVGEGTLMVLCAILISFIIALLLCDKRVALTPGRLIVGKCAETPDGYQKVFSDPSADYAVYVKTVYKADSLSSGDVVYVGVVGKVRACVLDVQEKTFVAKLIAGKASEFVKEGDVLYYDNHPVGYVTTVQEKGLLQCTFF